MERGKLILGTSGFSYPHWRDVFYPPGTPESRWLETYAEHFNAVELNVTFYRLPKRPTFVDWANRTPDDFRFVVKGSRVITHYHRLRNVETQVSALFSASSGLGGKLACVLWQLPPKAEPHVEVFDSFCSMLPKLARRRMPGVRLRHAFEFRDPRWFAPEVLDVLRKHGYALVSADPPREREPRELTADFAYLRFHHGHRPSGGYERDELRPYAQLANEWAEQGADVFAFFNNDPGGWAPRNGAEFQEMFDAEAGSLVGANVRGQGRR